MSEGRLKVLIVDDSASLREEMSDRFAADGHQVRTAPTGELALTALAEQPFDVAFVDLNLGGGMSGLKESDLYKRRVCTDLIPNHTLNLWTVRVSCPPSNYRARRRHLPKPSQFSLCPVKAAAGRVAGGGPSQHRPRGISFLSHCKIFVVKY